MFILKRRVLTTFTNCPTVYLFFLIFHFLVDTFALGMLSFTAGSAVYTTNWTIVARRPTCTLWSPLLVNSPTTSTKTLSCSHAAPSPRCRLSSTLSRSALSTYLLIDLLTSLLTNVLQLYSLDGDPTSVVLQIVLKKPKYVMVYSA